MLMNTSTNHDLTLNHHLNSLTPAQHAELVRFAELRLKRVRDRLPDNALADLSGEDLVQDALVAAPHGMTSAKTGRHPKPHNLASTDAWLHWLRSVINSRWRTPASRRPPACTRGCVRHDGACGPAAADG